MPLRKRLTEIKPEEPSIFGNEFTVPVADLHLHSYYSDGIYSPEYIMNRAESFGLKAISITDHDSIDAINVINNNGNNHEVELIPGIEFSCHYKSKEYHILGYLLDTNNNELLSKLAEIKLSREKRARKIVLKLNTIGFKFDFELILEKADKAPVTRPHIAAVMQDLGYVSNSRDAFRMYLGDGCVAYQEKSTYPIAECFKLINNTGGIAVLAHPGNCIDQKTIYEMIKLGMDGIEVVHPSHSIELEKYYREIAHQYWLLPTGGSDYHGSRDNDENNFGKYFVNYSVVESMKLRAASK